MSTDQRETDRFHPRLHHVAGDSLSDATGQTSGMWRREAISGRSVGSEQLWMGQTHVAARTSSGNHHHGRSETAIYVVSGTPEFFFLEGEGDEARETRVRTQPGDYIYV